MLQGLPKIKYDQDMTCEPCQKEKLIMSSFNRKNIVSTLRSFELLHLDVYCPTRIVSLGGKRYDLIIVDDFSRFT